MTPTPPFTDSIAVTSLAAEFGRCERLSPSALTVTVECRLVDLFSLRLNHIGCAGLRVTVRTPRPPTARTVHQLARARVSRLELTEPVAAATAVAWFETAKAAATLGLPLIWHGTLPVDLRRHARHLPPPSDDDRWRAAWSHGRLGWRRGPGFAEVLDRRRGHRRTLVDLAAVTAIFGEGLDCPSVFTGTAAELVEAGFAVPFQGEIVWLPYRLAARTRAAGQAPALP
jgi:hypothetical protein